MKTLSQEMIQAKRRFWRSAFWVVLLIMVVSIECLVIRSLINILNLQKIIDLTVYQMIIPIICGFSVVTGLIFRKLKPDLYDEYAKTSCITIFNQALKMAELHNQFAEERKEKNRIKIVMLTESGEEIVE